MISSSIFQSFYFKLFLLLFFIVQNYILSTRSFFIHVRKTFFAQPELTLGFIG